MNACLLARQSAAAGNTANGLAHAMPSYSTGGAFLGLQLTISCRGLDNKDGFGVSDPFSRFQSSRQRTSRPSMTAGAAGLKKYLGRGPRQELNPSGPCLLPLHENVCGFEHQVDRLLLVQVFDYDSVTDHDLIGEFTTSVQDLLTRHTERATASVEYPLVNTKKWAKETSRGKHYVHSGIMSIKVQEMKGLERPRTRQRSKCCVGHNWCASSETMERKGYVTGTFIGRGNAGRSSVARKRVGYSVHQDLWRKEAGAAGFKRPRV